MSCSLTAALGITLSSGLRLHTHHSRDSVPSGSTVCFWHRFVLCRFGQCLPLLVLRPSRALLLPRAASPGTWLETQNLRSSSRPAESEATSNRILRRFVHSPMRGAVADMLSTEAVGSKSRAVHGGRDASMEPPLGLLC